MSDKIYDGRAFWKAYRLVGSTKIIQAQNSSSKKCRFCGKDENSTTFKMQPHAFPELLGANNFVVGDECDSCNTFFSAFESHLSKFFTPYLTLLEIKGKKKVPDFHSRTKNNDELTRTILRRSDDNRLQLIIGEEDDIIINDENKTMSLRFRLPPHRPLYVYKALVKIGLSILPAQLTDKYKAVFEWLRGDANDTVYFPMAFITKIHRRKFDSPSAELYEAKQVFKQSEFCPELTLIVNFGNLVAQIFMPLSEHFDYKRSDKKSPVLELYPASAMYNLDKEKYRNAKPTDLVTIDFQFTQVDLSSNESTSRDEIINFSFKQFERGS